MSEMLVVTLDDNVEIFVVIIDDGTKGMIKMVMMRGDELY